MYSATNKTQSWLSWFLRGLLTLIFLTLIGRLIELQIIKGEYYQVMADENRIRRITIQAPRGRILARDGEVLADNKSVQKKVVFDSEGFKKTTYIEGASNDEIITEWDRVYINGSVTSHIIGYLGQANDKEVGKVKDNCPELGVVKLGTLIGRSGLEQQYDCLLSGIDGEELVEVDTQGKKVRTLGRRQPQKGQDIRTTIDINLQKEISRIMSDKKGAVIATTPEGEILAMYSAPSYDANLLVEGTQKDEIAKLFEDKNLPMFNRAIGGVYHPGSVFKPVVSLAALEENAIEPNFEYLDTGIISVNGFDYTNWYLTQYGGTEGEIGLERAIARSTDTFFYKIGEFMGVNALSNWSEKFGFGTKTEIDLPGEVSGLVPNPEWKKTVIGEPWYLGNTYHFSIGQGDLNVTPVQVSQSIAAIANKGELCNPHIFKMKETNCRDLELDKEYLEVVINGMIQACEEGGTGYTFFGFEPKVACKTGTAETGDGDTTHAWFVIFAPLEDPEIVLTVLVEKGGEGSSVAGPIARDVFNYWFGKPELPVTPTPEPEDQEEIEEM